MTVPDYSRLLSAANEYLDRGWSVLPIASDKKPAIKRWKPLQRERPNQSDFDHWFKPTASGASVVGLGIILGDVSGGLAVRDFDDPDAYESWKAQFPKFAETLPTVRTDRGFHVYARIPGYKTRKLGDGELRAEKAYVVAPPSMHASGAEYSWIVPLPAGEVPIVDEGLFLEGIDSGRHKSHNSIWREGREGREGPELPATPETRGSPASPVDLELLAPLDSPVVRGGHVAPASLVVPEALVYKEDTSLYIHNAITASLPKGVGGRNDAIFEFARRLKAINELAQCNGLQLRTAMEWWFKAARGIIGTKDWDESWSDFLHAWDNVKTPFGESMQAALETARKSPVPSCAVHFEAEPTRLLVRLCRELQRRNNGNPFFLDCRNAGEAIGTNKDSAMKRLRLLVKTGVLIRIKKGHTGRASEYLYTGD